MRTLRKVRAHGRATEVIDGTTRYTVWPGEPLESPPEHPALAWPLEAGAQGRAGQGGSDDEAPQSANGARQSRTRPGGARRRRRNYHTKKNNKNKNKNRNLKTKSTKR